MISPSLPELENARKQVEHLSFQYWYHNSLFSWQWWLLWFFLIFPWIVWWLFVDKKRIMEIFLYGLIVGMISGLLDIIGGKLLLWVYPHRLFWFLMPQIIPVNSSVLPVEYMLFYQYFLRWKHFFFVTVIMAFFNAFVAENIFEWLGLYRPIMWMHAYSIPLYILIALFSKWLVEKFKTIESR